MRAKMIKRLEKEREYLNSLSILDSDCTVSNSLIRSIMYYVKELKDKISELEELLLDTCTSRIVRWKINEATKIISLKKENSNDFVDYNIIDYKLVYILEKDKHFYYFDTSEQLLKDRTSVFIN